MKNLYRTALAALLTAAFVAPVAAAAPPCETVLCHALEIGDWEEVPRPWLDPGPYVPGEIITKSCSAYAARVAAVTAACDAALGYEAYAAAVLKGSGGVAYPNPEDPDDPWGPIGPVVRDADFLAAAYRNYAEHSASPVLKGVAYPNPEDPDVPWGPIGPVVKDYLDYAQGLEDYAERVVG